MNADGSVKKEKSRALGYYLCKVSNLRSDTTVKVDDSVYYEGGGYTVGYDIEAEAFAKEKDSSAYIWLSEGTHTVDFYGIPHAVSAKSELDLEELNIAKYKPAAATTVFVYNGKQRKPVITVKGLKEGRDFSVKYTNNVKPGIAKATVTGIAPYINSKTVTYKIKPAKVTINSPATTKKAITVKWKKTPGTGYQVQVAKVSKVKKGLKSFKVSSGSTSKKVKSLKQKTKYYVRVRVYVNTAQGTLYGSWSSTKSIRCR